MSDMDKQRFETLAEAYGGAIGRWPAEMQDAAFAWLAQAPEEAQAVLNDAMALDEALHVLRPPAPSMALRDSILAMAPRPRRASLLRRWLAGAGIGAALAAACAAGVVIGVGVGSPHGVSAPDETALSASADEDWVMTPDTESQS